MRSLSATTVWSDAGEIVSRTPASVIVPWLELVAWVVVVPALVGLLIAGVMRSAPVTAPRRRTG